MKWKVLMIFPILWIFECLAKPVEQGSEVLVDVTPYPDAQKHYINPNNVSPDVSDFMRINQINFTKINTQKEMLQNRTKGLPSSEQFLYQVIPSSTLPTPTEAKAIDEEIRLINIRNSLVKTLRETNDNEQQADSEFDYSLAAVCEVPKHTNISEWFGDNTWNIFFKPTYKQYNVKSIMLRLYKATGSEKGSKECELDVSEFYKLTVSVYTRKQRKTKKKQIYATMVRSNFHGWVEIDALSTMKYWESTKNNFGLAIDIYDENDNHLNAKMHFHLQDCQAAPQIPWRAFKLLSESSAGTSNVPEDGVEILRNLHTGPRLDIISTRPAIYSSSGSDEHSQQKRHLRHTHHRHPQRSSEEEYDEESHESTHHSSAELRRDHSHRSHSQVGET